LLLLPRKLCVKYADDVGVFPRPEKRIKLFSARNIVGFADPWNLLPFLPPRDWLLSLPIVAEI
jgi:hypothetical protein